MAHTSALLTVTPCPLSERRLRRISFQPVRDPGRSGRWYTLSTSGLSEQMANPLHQRCAACVQHVPFSYWKQEKYLSDNLLEDCKRWVCYCNFDSSFSL